MANKFEISKSSRASCRKCKEKIPKGEIRFGEEVVFRRDGQDYPSFKWFHFDCAISKFEDKLAFADEVSLLSDKQHKILKQMKKKARKSKFTFRNLNELDGNEGIINVSGTVQRSLKEREMETLTGELMNGKVVYIADNEDSYAKVILWDSANKKVNKNDKLILLNSMATIGNDDKVEIHELTTSKFALNEDVAFDIQEEVYKSTAWNRPNEGDVEFEYAPSGRASCTVCAEKIAKDTLKIVKPVWGENEQTKTVFPSKESMHVQCSLEDEDANELLKEAISRLSPQLVSENQNTLNELKSSIQEEKLKAMLSSILSY